MYTIDLMILMLFYRILKMTTKFLENYCCPDLTNIKVSNVLYLIKNGMCVANYLQKLTLNPSLGVTVIGLSRRLCRTYNMHRNNVGFIFLYWCEELINNCVRVIEDSLKYLYAGLIRFLKI